MDTGELIIRWTVRLAVICYAAVLLLAMWQKRAPATTSLSRWIWTAGCLLFVGHVLSAFAFYHHWSHQHAFDDTREKTVAAIGVAFGWGIYVNHLFTLVWIADVAWSWLAAESYRRRPLVIVFGLHAFMLFIAVNGLMVFKDGAIRWISAAVLLLLVGVGIGTLTWRRGQRSGPFAEAVSLPQDPQ